MQQVQQMHKKRRACYDFMRKGQCQRGDACTYAHVTAEAAQEMGMQVPANIIAQGATAAGTMPHPAANAFMMQQAAGGFMPHNPMIQQQQRPGFFPGQMRPPMQNTGHPQMISDPHQYSATAVFVSNIPDEFLNEATVRDFFGRFGEIKEVRLDFQRHSATVDYADAASQTQALNTPEAVFNNRFVRVLKARAVQGLPSDPAGAAASNGEASVHPAASVPGAAQNSNAVVNSSASQPPMWRPKSAAIKKAELIEKYVEQQKELMKKLTTTKDMSAQTRKIIMDSINQIQKKIDDIRKPKTTAPTDNSKPAEHPAAQPSEATTEYAAGGAEEETHQDAVTQSDHPSNAAQLDAIESEKQALQEKLKALQQEAARMGVTVSARGAHRGAHRGTSTRGGMANRGSMSLDKRPRALVLRNLSQEAAERLDSEMAQFGEVESIEKMEEDSGERPPFAYCVRFKARWEAENAMKVVDSLDSFAGVTVEWNSQ
ncbi:hypothetical protein FB639_004851 [Coemansia asiatica]|nr:hypothetical protein FB639_004851 [Coemansia asiatica]